MLLLGGCDLYTRVFRIARALLDITVCPRFQRTTLASSSQRDQYRTWLSHSASWGRASRVSSSCYGYHHTRLLPVTRALLFATISTCTSTGSTSVHSRNQAIDTGAGFITWQSGGTSMFLHLLAGHRETAFLIAFAVDPSS